MLTMQFLIVLTLFAVQSLAKPSIYKDFVDYAAFDYLNDPNHEPTEVKPECKLDLLIIWDNSRSIGKSAFDNQVKDFFRNLINDEYLNVGPEGTHLAIITFSTQNRTKELLKFGSKTTKAELLQYINGLTWSELEGDATRTGMALMLGSQVFHQKSPLNGGVGRSNVKDVTMILTDGKPIRAKGDTTFGFYDYDNRPEETASGRRSQGETKMAKAFSAKLRNNSRVVGVYIGNNGDPKLLEQWTTTPSDAIHANRAEFDKVVSTMVDKSCKKPDCKKDPTNPECIKPGECECASTTAVKYVKSDEISGEVYWEKPSLTCSANTPVITEVVVNPPGTESPKDFDVGRNHTISYTYKYQNGANSYLTHTCKVTVQVKVCDCPSKDMGVFYARPNFPTCLPHFEVPKPNCAGLSVGGVSTGVVPDPFQIGKHTRTYGYVMTNGRKVDCHLNFEIKVIPCGGKNYNPDKEVCCQGQLHAKKNQWECCGSNYFNKAAQKCCSVEYGNVVSDTAECTKACPKR